MHEQTPQHGSFAKILVILALVGFAGVAFVGAGTFLFLNRDKYLASFRADDEEAALTEGEGAELREARRPVVASAPIPASERRIQLEPVTVSIIWALEQAWSPAIAESAAQSMHSGVRP